MASRNDDTGPSAASFICALAAEAALLVLVTPPRCKAAGLQRMRNRIDHATYLKRRSLSCLYYGTDQRQHPAFFHCPGGEQVIITEQSWHSGCIGRHNILAHSY